MTLWLLLLSVLIAVPARAQNTFKMPDQRALGIAASRLATSTYSTVVPTNGAAPTVTCTAIKGTHPSRDLITQTLTTNITYTTPPAAAGCIDGDVIEAYFIQGDSQSFTVTLADGLGTTHTGTLFAMPVSTGAAQHYFLWFTLTYHASISQWSLGGQATNPSTPVPVSQGGTQCGSPCNGSCTFANLPTAPVQGAICTVTDAPACNSGAILSAGGGSTKCQVWYSGVNWFPGGGSLASAGGAGTSPQLAYYAATGSTSVGASNSSWNNSNAVLSLGSNPPSVIGSGQHGIAMSEGTAPTAAAGADLLYALASAHQWYSSLNGGTGLEVPQVIAKGTSALATGSIPSATCANSITTAATGVAATDVVSWSHNTNVVSATNGSLIIHAYPTSGNVNFQECNPTAAPIVPPADTLNWIVIR